MTGKCPKCEALVTQVTIDEVDASVLGGTTWRAITYQCPYCQTVLGVGLDPIALKTDTVDEVVERLQKAR